MRLKENTLTSDQLTILKTLYTFRFITTELISQNLNLKYKNYADKKLRRLYDLGYIGRNYNSSYKLLGKPAVYYLLPKAFSVLRKQDGIFKFVLHNIYNDPIASQRFIDKNLAIYKAYIALKKCYSGKLMFYTGSNLKNPNITYFPNPLPDGFFSIEFNKRKRKYYFLLYCSSQLPLFVHLRTLKVITDYQSSKKWQNVTKTNLSGILILTDTSKFKNLLVDKMAKLLYKEGLASESSFYICTLNALSHITKEVKDVWQPITHKSFSVSLKSIDNT